MVFSTRLEVHNRTDLIPAPTNDEHVADRTVHVVTMSSPSSFVGGCDDDGLSNLLAGEMPVFFLATLRYVFTFWTLKCRESWLQGFQVAILYSIITFMCCIWDFEIADNIDVLFHSTSCFHHVHYVLLT